jgi:hypothetical protein
VSLRTSRVSATRQLVALKQVVKDVCYMTNAMSAMFQKNVLQLIAIAITTVPTVNCVALMANATQILPAKATSTI